MVLDSQAAVVDDLDDAAQAALVQLGRRDARQRAIAEEDGAVVCFLPASVSIAYRMSWRAGWKPTAALPL